MRSDESGGRFPVSSEHRRNQVPFVGIGGL